MTLDILALLSSNIELFNPNTLTGITFPLGVYSPCFMTPTSATDMNKVQRLMTGIWYFRKQFARGKEPTPYYGLPNSLNELLVINGKRLMDIPGIKFVEDEEEVAKEGRIKPRMKVEKNTYLKKRILV